MNQLNRAKAQLKRNTKSDDLVHTFKRAEDEQRAAKEGTFALLKAFQNLKTERNQLQNKYIISTENNETLQAMVQQLREDKGRLATQLKEQEDENKTLENDNQSLRAQLRDAQSRILTMTRTVSTRQQLPAVPETVTRFGTLYKQQRQCASKLLRKWLKQRNGWPPDYLREKVHELMFKLLIKSYREVTDSKNRMFKNIIGALNMERTLQSNADDEKGNDIGSQEAPDWFTLSTDIISKRFKDYFKSNYETVLDRERVTKDVLDWLKNDDNADLKDLKEDGEEWKALEVFVKECCDICWIMILQATPLGLKPMDWRAPKGVLYDEEQHDAVRGSDIEDRTVLYYVWPVVTEKDEKDTILDNQKQKVMVQKSFCKLEIGWNKK